MSSHEKIIEHFLGEKKLSNLELDKICREMSENEIIDQRISGTGSTLLGVAIAFLDENVARYLLKHGADVNLCTGLKGKESLPPLVVIIRKIHKSDFKNVFDMPEKKTETFICSKNCDCKNKKIKIFDMIISNKNIKIDNPVLIDGSKKTIQEWSESFKDDHDYKIFYEKIKNINFFYDKISNFGWLWNGKLIDGFCESSMKEKNGKKYILKKLPYYIKENKKKSSDKIKKLTKKEAFDEVSSKDGSQYILFNDRDSDRADELLCCGQVERSEILITSFSGDLISKNLSDRLKYVRCQREVVAMEWHRLFNSKQPKYGIVVNEYDNTSYVATEYLENAISIKEKMLDSKLGSYIYGFAENYLDILITNDVDPNIRNFLFLDNTFIHIDGDKCFARLRDPINAYNFNISHCLEKILKKELRTDQEKYFFWNLLGIYNFGKEQIDRHGHYLEKMIKKDEFQEELHSAILKRIIFCENLIEKFISFYVCDTYELRMLQNHLVSGIESITNAALRDDNFQGYLISEKSEKDLDNFVDQLKYFEIRDGVGFEFTEKDIKLAKKRYESIKAKRISLTQTTTIVDDVKVAHDHSHEMIGDISQESSNTPVSTNPLSFWARHPNLKNLGIATAGATVTTGVTAAVISGVSFFMADEPTSKAKAAAYLKSVVEPGVMGISPKLEAATLVIGFAIVLTILLFAILNGLQKRKGAHNGETLTENKPLLY